MCLDVNSHVPVYEQIMAHVRTGIAAGIYRAGEILPSVRATALRFVVNPNTVQRAYQELEREGLIETRKGRGAFVTADGAVSALGKTATAVRAHFAEGVRLGRAARFKNPELNTLFQQELRANAAASPARAPSDRSTDPDSPA